MLVADVVLGQASWLKVRRGAGVQIQRDGPSTQAESRTDFAAKDFRDASVGELAYGTCADKLRSRSQPARSPIVLVEVKITRGDRVNTIHLPRINP